MDESVPSCTIRDKWRSSRGWIALAICIVLLLCWFVRYPQPKNPWQYYPDQLFELEADARNLSPQQIMAGWGILKPADVLSLILFHPEYAATHHREIERRVPSGVARECCRLTLLGLTSNDPAFLEHKLACIRTLKKDARTTITWKLSNLVSLRLTGSEADDTSVRPDLAREYGLLSLGLTGAGISGATFADLLVANDMRRRTRYWDSYRTWLLSKKVAEIDKTVDPGLALLLAIGVPDLMVGHFPFANEADLAMNACLLDEELALKTMECGLVFEGMRYDLKDGKWCGKVSADSDLDEIPEVAIHSSSNLDAGGIRFLAYSLKYPTKMKDTFGRRTREIDAFYILLDAETPAERRLAVRGIWMIGQGHGP